MSEFAQPKKSYILRKKKKQKTGFLTGKMGKRDKLGSWN